MEQKIIEIDNGFGDIKEKMSKKISEMNKQGYRFMYSNTIPAKIELADARGMSYSQNERILMFFERY